MQRSIPPFSLVTAFAHELFRSQRDDIEQGLDSDETSTEDLRVALRRYRNFFDHLQSVSSTRLNRERADKR